MRALNDFIIVKRFGSRRLYQLFCADRYLLCHAMAFIKKANTETVAFDFVKTQTVAELAQ